MLEFIQGTILEKVFAVAQSGKFAEFAEIQEGEKQIGEANALEKALFTMKEQIETNHVLAYIRAM